MKVSIAGSLRDREVACSASDRQGSNFESCVWRTVSSQSSHHPQEALLAQFSLYVHKGGLKPDSFHFCSTIDPCLASPANLIYGGVEAKVLSHVTFMPVLLRPVNIFLGQVTGNVSEGKYNTVNNSSSGEVTFQKCLNSGITLFSSKYSNKSQTFATGANQRPHEARSRSVSLGTRVHRPTSCSISWGGGPRVVVSTAAFHARVRGSVPGLGGFKKTKNVSSPSTCESQYCGEPP